VKPGDLAESIINGFSIRDPKDIDVEAISFDSGMQVRFRHLEGCAATLIGVGNSAIATVSPSDSPGRDRFSIGHELGHWKMHRGQSFVCRTENIGKNEASNNVVEKAADEFSAHLLMPTHLMKVAIEGLKRLGFSDVDRLRDDFSTSRLAMAFRLVKFDTFPIILICYSSSGWEWSFRSRAVPSRWWVKKALDSATFAHDLLNRGIHRKGAGQQSADAWFDNDDAEKYEVSEECVPYGTGRALVLLHLSDAMLNAGYDKDLWTGRSRG
jgi:hypothetical protein